MSTKRVFGPTFPDQEAFVSDLDMKPTVTETEIDQYKAELTVCETIGPLLPGFEVLEEVRHVQNKDDGNAKAVHTPHSWMSDKLPPSQIDPLKSLKSRGFCMDSRNYLNLSVANVGDEKSDGRESLMDIHRRTLQQQSDGADGKAVERQSRNRSPQSDSSVDKKQKKKKSKKRKSERKSEKKKKKKAKRSRQSESQCESDAAAASEHKAKKSKTKGDKSDSKKTAALPFKWSPFAANTDRRPFDRDAEIVSATAGAMSDTAKAALLKQAHSMSSEFARPSADDR